jgi:L-asparagine transporter-like permease
MSSSEKVPTPAIFRTFIPTIVFVAVNLGAVGLQSYDPPADMVALVIVIATSLFAAWAYRKEAKNQRHPTYRRLFLISSWGYIFLLFMFAGLYSLKHMVSE